MTNPHLVPKQITDKNGVLSTRWVKPEQGAASTASMLPAPTLTVAKEPVHADTETVRKAAALYTEIIAYDEDYGDEVFADVLKEFGSYPAVMVDEILAKSSNIDMKMWGLKDLIDIRLSYDKMDGHCLVLRDYLNLCDYADDLGVNNNGQACVTIYCAVSSYEGLEPVAATGSYPEKRKKQLEGIIGGTTLIKHLVSEKLADSSSLAKIEGKDESVIADQRLVDLFINRPEDSGTVLKFMEERNTADYDRIIEYLDSETPAVSSGLL